MIPDTDVHIFTTDDGEQLIINNTNPPLFIPMYGSFGAPAIEYQTRRGYKQDGATVIDLHLATRPITISFHRSAECTREEYWEVRAALIDLLRPNRGNNGALTYTLRRAGGTKRSLVIYPMPGFTFPPTSPDENSWQIDEPVNFVAFDPVWFDPSTAAVAFSGVAASHLIFPETFPIVFSPDGTEYTATVTYLGNWVSYPVIAITGPYATAVIENVTTGVSFSLIQNVGAGEQRIITLTQGAQSIVDQNGVNKFGDLSDTSNLVDWNLRPAPMVAGGVNQLRMTLTGGVLGTSDVSIAYNSRYMGI